jgi:hypothetical protein
MKLFRHLSQVLFSNPVFRHFIFNRLPNWTVLKTWQIGSISDSIGLDGFGAKACGGSQGFSISMIG